MGDSADAKKRLALAGQIEDLVLQDTPSLYLFSVANQVVATSNVSGVYMHPIDYYLITKDLTIAGK